MTDKKRPDLHIADSGSASSSAIDKAMRLSDLADLADFDSVREEILANFLAENNFTIEKTPEGMFATANTTGTRKTVREFFQDVMRAKIRQNSN